MRQCWVSRARVSKAESNVGSYLVVLQAYAVQLHDVTFIVPGLTPKKFPTRRAL